MGGGVILKPYKSFCLQSHLRIYDIFKKDLFMEEVMCIIYLTHAWEFPNIAGRSF